MNLLVRDLKLGMYLVFPESIKQITSLESLQGGKYIGIKAEDEQLVLCPDELVRVETPAAVLRQRAIALRQQVMTEHPEFDEYDIEAFMAFLSIKESRAALYQALALND